MSKRPYYFIISNGYTNYIIQSSQVTIPNDTDEESGGEEEVGRKGLPSGEERRQCVKTVDMGVVTVERVCE
jgi:hypothetical protein